MNSTFSSNTSSLFAPKTSGSSFGNFGISATTQSSSLFTQNKSTFGSNQNPQTGFSFGTSNSSVFGTSTNVTSTGFSFGTSTTKPAFGTVTNQTNSLGFNATTSVGNFGSPSTLGNFNGNTQNTVSQNEYELFIASIAQPLLLGDDRDVIISRWNQLQAMWGFGTGLSIHGKVTYTPENCLCRFKSVSFNQIPNCDDSDGFVSLLIKNPFKEVAQHKLKIQEKLHQLLNSQIHSIVIEDIRPAIKVPNNQLQPSQPKPGFGFLQQPQTSSVQPVPTVTSNIEYTDVFVKVNETINGITRSLPGSTVALQFKNEPLKSKLESELCVVDVVPQMAPNSKEVSDYLNGPAPRGLDVEMWELAKQHCSNSSSLVPVPTIGFVELKSRIKGQIEFAQAQLATIRNEAETVSEMKTKVISLSGKLEKLKRKEVELSNRILKILCTQEIVNRQGYTLSAGEEALKCSLDKLWNQIVGPYGIKSRLQEILSAPKTVCINSSNNSRLSYNDLSPEAMDELKEYFMERQKSIKEMMSLIREDLACLNIIEK